MCPHDCKASKTVFYKTQTQILLKKQGFILVKDILRCCRYMGFVLHFKTNAERCSRMGRGRSRVIGMLIFLCTKLSHAGLWNEVPSLQKHLCARNFGSCVVPSSLPAGTTFPTQRNGKFQVHAFANCSNLVSKVLIKCWGCGVCG